MKKILAVASGGGHWKQLMLIRPSFSNHKEKFVTTINGLPQQESIKDYEIVTDSNKNNKVALLKTFIELFLIIICYRPSVIITTGAAPGLFAIIIGRFVFSKTIWVDSIANSEELSLCGRLSKYFAHTVLTQWENLAKNSHAEYKGSVF